MSDEADRADQEVERDIAEALRLRRPAGPAPIGYCHFCGEALLRPDARWCEAECERGWEYEQERQTANGRIPYREGI